MKMMRRDTAPERQVTKNTISHIDGIGSGPTRSPMTNHCLQMPQYGGHDRGWPSQTNDLNMS